MMMYLLALFVPPRVKTTILFLFLPLSIYFPFQNFKGNFTVFHFVSLFCFLGSDYIIIIVIITIINIIDISDTQLLWVCV